MNPDEPENLMTKELGEVLEQLPHGPEFRLVDELRYLEPGVEAEATYHIRGDERFLEGYFPGYPLLPGVILIEALAQVGGIVVQSAEEKNGGGADSPPWRLTGVREAMILGEAVPGHTMVIKARLANRLGKMAQIEGSVETDSRLELLTASVVLSCD